MLELVMGGVPVTGTPEFAICRIFDQQWWNGTAFASGTRIDFAMPQVTYGATVVQGVHHYQIPAGKCTRPADEAQDGYFVIMTDPSNGILEHMRVHVTNLPAWADNRADYTGVGTFGEGVLVHHCNTDSIDAGSIATDAFGSLELAADAAAEIATAVWEANIGGFSVAGQAGKDVHDLILSQVMQTGATPDGRFTSTITNGVGKVYAANVPTPATADANALVGLTCALRTATGGAFYKVASVQNDGSGDFLQLVTVDTGSTTIAISTNDFAFVQMAQPTASAAAMWDEAMSAHTTGGTFGDGIRRILGLRQSNMRVVYTAWNAANVPTAGTVYIYDSKADADADVAGTGVGSTGSYAWSASFSGTLQPTMYSSTKIT